VNRPRTAAELRLLGAPRADYEAARLSNMGSLVLWLRDYGPLDPLNPVFRLASEQRQFAKRVAAIKDIERETPQAPITLNSSEALLRLYS
jgi:hypothetical protein